MLEKCECNVPRNDAINEIIYSYLLVFESFSCCSDNNDNRKRTTTNNNPSSRYAAKNVGSVQ